jgi:uncharacterized protein (DUF3084 family)
VKDEHQKGLIDYVQARSEMAQAVNEVDQCIADIDQARNELQKWKEHGGAIDIKRLPSVQELAKSLNAYNTARIAAERAARNLPDTIRQLFQSV